MPFKREKWPEYILRLGVSGCFIGHGVFGVLIKTAWLPFFSFVGISPKVAYSLMPFVGVMDICFGFISLLRPNFKLLLFMSLWAFWTALLRPLTGLSIWEFVERAGNYSVPLALAFLLDCTNDSAVPRERVLPRRLKP